MRLSCRTEFVLDAEMNLLLPAEGEPEAAAFGKLRRLFQFCQAEDAGIELPRRILLASRHRQLDVVQPEIDATRFTPPPGTAPPSAGRPTPVVTRHAPPWSPR